MSIIREYFYPILLALFRGLFGNQKYLQYVVILQGIINAYVAWNLTEYLRKKFDLNSLITYAVLGIQLATSIMNRFFAGRGSMYSNSILTEGITIPLFILLVRYLYSYIVDDDRRSIIISTIVMFVLISTRKQMYIAIPLMVIAFAWNACRHNKRVVRSIVMAVIIAIVTFMTMTLCDHIYNYSVHGRFVGHTSDSRFMMTLMMYTSEKNESELVREAYRSVFLDIYDECDAQNYLMHSAEKGWLNSTNHFGDYYDLVQEVCTQKAHEYVINNYTDELTDRNVIVDDINRSIVSSLFLTNIPRMGKVLFDNLLSGFVTTVSVKRQFFIQYAVLFYIVYIAILAVLVVGSTKKEKTVDETGILAIFAIFATILNVMLVSMVIFCQTRYTIYNMSLMYISMLLMIIRVLDLRRKAE